MTRQKRYLYLSIVFVSIGIVLLAQAGGIVEANSAELPSGFLVMGGLLFIAASAVLLLEGVVHSK